ncbi:MAG: hypothetical protein K2Y37_02965 [Pirellulales bacterium]|nr:hypothetical protein [Pirellulales bacterium]
MFHQQRHHDGQEFGGWDFRTKFNLAYLVVSGFTTCFTVFLRHRFGREALGLRAVIGILAMVVYMATYPESAAMSGYFFLWWIALVLQRLGHFVRRTKGIVLHSRFEGEPWIGALLPPALREGGAKFLEVVLCVLVAAMLQGDDMALANFMFLGAASLTVKAVIDGRADYRRVAQMRDAEIEQRAMLDRWRGGRF